MTATIGRPREREDGSPCAARHCTEKFRNRQGGWGMCPSGYKHAQRQSAKGCNCSHCVLFMRKTSGRRA